MAPARYRTGRDGHNRAVVVGHRPTARRFAAWRELDPRIEPRASRSRRCAACVAGGCVVLAALMLVYARQRGAAGAG